jgi:hypothetical protein
LKKKARAFNNAARTCPFLMLTDLDKCECPATLIGDWLDCPKHKNFLFRVAVREIEAWLLGDAYGFSTFFGIRYDQVNSHPESLPNPKEELLRLAFSSPRRNLRDAVVVEEEHQFYQGPDYNGALSTFVSGDWDLKVASKCCPSLKRCLAALARFETGD